MPIYEYECGRCGPFEVMQKITEEPLKACEKCGRPVHRLVSLSSFALVGGGWYKDLYGSSKSSSTTTKDGESKPPKPEKKGESKPAAATAPEKKTETKASSKPASSAAA